MKWQRLIIPLIPFTYVLAGTVNPAEPAGVVDTYTAASSNQTARLRGATMEVEIDASLPKLHKQGRLQALRRISRLGRVTYEVIHFEGDRSIKNDVIARYLAADTQPQANDGASVAVTPANYKFKYKGMAEKDGRAVHVFQLTPRKKRVGLFKGELWLDAETCLPVRESGRLVKSPSIFLRRIEFVREYEIREGLAVPHSVDSVVDTRVVGKAELRVRFQNFSLPESPAVSMAVGSGQ
ncbi:MAG TPA: hypothetical protein VLX58_03395 [Bryobacteraceae bacterium]|nr:hypothetical protein [Bryobacteraceae bacterium]